MSPTPLSPDGASSSLSPSSSPTPATKRPRRVLAPSIPQRKASHPDTRAAGGSSSKAASLAQLIAEAARARAAQNGSPSMAALAQSQSQSQSPSSSSAATPKASAVGLPAVNHSKSASTSSASSLGSWTEYANFVDSEELEQIRASGEFSPGIVQEALAIAATQHIGMPNDEMDDVQTQTAKSTPLGALGGEDGQDGSGSEDGESDIEGEEITFRRDSVAASSSTVTGLGIEADQDLIAGPSSSVIEELDDDDPDDDDGHDAAAALRPRRKRETSVNTFGAAKSRHSTASSIGSLDARTLSTDAGTLSSAPTTLSLRSQASPASPNIRTPGSISSPTMGTKRRPKPSSLSLGPSSPQSTISKGLASPIVRGRTPPPTKPPAEPLPPVPPNASVGAAAAALHASTVTAENEQRGLQRSSSSASAPFEWSSRPPSQALEPALKLGLGPRTRTMSAGTAAGIPPERAESRAAAAVASNHLETLAGAQSAEAVLRATQPEATYDEKHAAADKEVLDDEGGEDGDDNDHEDDEVDDDDDDDYEDGEEVAVVQKGFLVQAPGTGSTGDLKRAASMSKPERVAPEDLVRVRGAGGKTASMVSLASPASSTTENGRRPSLVESKRRQSSEALQGDWTPPEAAQSTAPTTYDVEPNLASSSADTSYRSQDSTAGDAKSDPAAPGKTRNQVVGDRVKGAEGRFAGVFGEIAVAFKQLQAEKRTLEKVIRATTPLGGLGENGEDFVRYLTTMNAKLDLSSSEIRKLLDLLERQRATMDYMLEIHQAEIDSHLDEIDDVRDELDYAIQAIETHKATAAKASAELAKARSEALSARQDAARVKASVADEAKKRERAIVALEQAKLGLQTAEKNKADAAERERALLAELDELKARKSRGDASPGAAATPSSAADIDRLTAEHEREIWNLKEEHERHLADQNDQIEKAAGELMQTHSEALAMLRAEQAETIDELQARIAALESSQEASLQAKRELMEAADAKDEEVARLQHQIEQLTLRERERERAGSGSAPVDATSLTSSSDEGPARKDGAATTTSATSTPIVTGPSTVPGLPALTGPPTEQVKQLQSQLQEQRARESQIRSAYKLLRDEHRRLQNAVKERGVVTGAGGPAGTPSAGIPAGFSLGGPSSRHGHDSFDFSIGGGSGGSQLGHGVTSSTPSASGPPPSSYFAPHSPGSIDVTSFSAARGANGGGGRALKRLSLPLASATIPPNGAPGSNGHGLVTTPGGLAFPEHIVNALSVHNGGRGRGDSTTSNSTSGTGPQHRGSFAGSLPGVAAQQQQQQQHPSSPTTYLPSSSASSTKSSTIPAPQADSVAPGTAAVRREGSDAVEEVETMSSSSGSGRGSAPPATVTTPTGSGSGSGSGGIGYISRGYIPSSPSAGAASKAIFGASATTQGGTSEGE